MPLDPEKSDLNPQLGSALDKGMEAAFGSGKSPSDSVIRILQARTNSKLGVHLPDSDGPGEAPVKIDDATRALRDANGRYQVVGEIARGGMGVVYKGRDSDLGRDVAIKVLHGKFEGSAEVLERFVEEAQIGGQLQHPGIVPVYELGLDRSEQPYFAMKLVKGETLAAQLSRRSDPSEDRRRFLGVFEQICQTMAYAHVRHVVHRDLKPANVMIGSFGEVQVVDWGFAKVLPAGGVADEKAAKESGGGARSVIETVRSDGSAGTHSVMGSMLGTPGYMPPEQAIGDVDRMDERSDVFGLGAILCEILTGQPPYLEDDGDLVQQAARGDTSGAIARVEASGANAAVIALCKQCLSPARAARPASAKEVADEVGAYLSSVEERARAAEVHAAEARVRARSTLVLSAVAILVLLVGGGGYYWLESEAAARRANAEGLVATALQKASARHGEAAASGFGDLATWTDALAAAEEAERLARSEFVGDALKANVAEFVRSTQRDHDKAKAVAAQHEKDRVMRQALLEARTPADEHVTGEAFEKKEPLRIHEAYTAAFHTYLDDRKLQDVSVEDAAAALKGSAISVELAAALDHWWLTRLSAEMPGDLNTKLRQLTRRLDPDDEWRNRLRDLLPDAEEHKAELVQLAQTADFDTLPTLSLVLLGDGLWEADAQADAVSIFERAHLLHPADFGLCFALALKQGKMKDNEASLANYRIAVALRPDMARAWIRLGWALAEVARFSDAAACGRRALAIDPSSTNAHNLLGVALVKHGNVDEGIASFRRALEIDPIFTHAHGNLGLALVQQGKLDEAIASFRQVLAIDPEDAKAHGEIGNALSKQGKLDEAIASLRSALAIDPKHILTLGRLGQIQLRQQNHRESIATYRRLLAIDPKHERALKSLAGAHFLLGRVQGFQGKLDEGIASFRRALEIFSKLDDAQSKQAVASLENVIDLFAGQLRLTPSLLAIARGEAKAGSAVEWTSAADAADRQGEHVTAVRVYTDAFSAHEDLLGVDALRYKAARAAVLAATGQAEDGKALTEAECAKLRSQAYAWLVAELEHENRKVDRKERMVEMRLRLWQKDPGFAGMRDPEKLAALPKAEAERWNKLWQEVQATLDRAMGKQGP